MTVAKYLSPLGKSFYKQTVGLPDLPMWVRFSCAPLRCITIHQDITFFLKRYFHVEKSYCLQPDIVLRALKIVRQKVC